MAPAGPVGPQIPSEDLQLGATGQELIEERLLAVGPGDGHEGSSFRQAAAPAESLSANEDWVDYRIY